VRSLPARQRRIGSGIGAAAAVVLRVGLTFIAAQILNVEYLKLAGGLFVLWIAVKVLVDASEPPELEIKPKHLLQAVWYIVVADLTMSTDNVVAVAPLPAAARADAFRAGREHPVRYFSANLLADLMNRYPILIYAGAGILGQVAGEMILTDRFVDRHLHPSDMARYIVEGVLVVAVMAAGKLLCRKRAGRRAG